MGKGLNPQQSGVHVAFAAGTGVLTFMDFVANIALRALEKTNSPQIQAHASTDYPFKFVFHVLFPNE